jgi:hypothetical protein
VVADGTNGSGQTAWELWPMAFVSQGAPSLIPASVAGLRWMPSQQACCLSHSPMPCIRADIDHRALSFRHPVTFRPKIRLAIIHFWTSLAPS